MKKGHWSPEEHEYLRNHYTKDGSINVGKFLNRSHRAVGCMARYLGLKRGWGNKPRYRKYAVNDQVFKTWSRVSAYLIGAILADGNIGEREFNIVSKDENWLKKIKSALKSEHPISVFTGQNTYRLRIGNKSMVNDLKSIGLTENKSKTLTLPDVPDRFFFDFLRGYIDGDGSIWYRPKKSLIIKITTGSPYILDDLSDTITKLLGIERHAPSVCVQKRHQGISTWYNLTYCGNCAANICEALYSNSSDLCLTRKKHAFLSYKNRSKRDERSKGNASKYYSD